VFFVASLYHGSVLIGLLGKPALLALDVKAIQTPLSMFH
jgi:hypothetical protein